MWCVHIAWYMDGYEAVGFARKKHWHQEKKIELLQSLCVFDALEQGWY